MITSQKVMKKQDFHAINHTVWIDKHSPKSEPKAFTSAANNEKISNFFSASYLIQRPRMFIKNLIVWHFNYLKFITINLRRIRTVGIHSIFEWIVGLRTHIQRNYLSSSWRNHLIFNLSAQFWNILYMYI